MAEQDLTAEQIEQFRMHSYKFGGQYSHNFSVLCRMAARTAEVEARCREMEKTITMSSGVALEGVTKAISRGETLQSEIAALRKAVEVLAAEAVRLNTDYGKLRVAVKATPAAREWPLVVAALQQGVRLIAPTDPIAGPAVRKAGSK